jgi:O-antigen/teichoic acid export membrane protein
MSSACAIHTIEVAPTARRWWSDSFWAAVANLSQAAGPFVGLLLLARWHGLEAAGQFAYAQAVTAPLAQLLNFQLKALILTHGVDELPVALASSIRLLSFPLALLLGVVLGIGLNPVAGLWMIARVIDSWAEVFQANDQRLGRMPRAALSVALRAVGLVVCLALLPGASEAVLAYLVISLMLLIFLDWKFTPLQLQLHWLTLRPILQRGSLLGLMLFLQAAASSLPRIVLEGITDAATLGLFASLSILVQIGNLLASSYGQGLLPLLPQAPLRRIAFWCSIPFVAALAALLFEVWSEPLILRLLQLAPTPETSQILLSLGLGQLTIWPAAMIGYALTARRQYSSLLWIGGILVASSAVASALLIPHWGASGAAFAMTFSGAITLLCSFWCLARHEVQS